MGNSARIAQKRGRHGFGDAVSPLAHEKRVADLIMEETRSARLDARSRVERRFDARIAFLVKEPGGQN